jgi:pseudouridine-5'-phosphate glycosidase
LALAAPAAGAAETRTAATSMAHAAARPATTGPAVFYTITVTITDRKITLSRQDLPQTYSARFNIRNLGTKAHSFTLGPTLNGKATVVSRLVEPKAHAVAFFIQNGIRGVLRYYSSVRSDRAKRAMQGVFTIS